MTDAPRTLPAAAHPAAPPGEAPAPGVRLTGDGIEVAVVSAVAERVQLCLLDDGPDGGLVEERVELTGRTGDLWHGRVAGVRPGQRYGLRVHGPHDPSRGLRCDPAKLLADPRALAFDGALVEDPSLYAYGADTSRVVPHGVIVGSASTAEPCAHDRPPRRPWSQTVLYELHVKAFTALHPGVPARLRGTYAGLAHPAALEHLVDLGVTAVELLPIQQSVSEPHLLRRGLVNHWGYNTLGWFAPHAAYSASGSRGEQVDEVRAMVRALHAAGLEVVLDVVYNHSADGDEEGPTLGLRGLDDAGSYRHREDRGRYDDATGCGNTLDLRSPHVLALVMDSLRHWVSDIGVDGFRFDLAPALTRGDHGPDLRGPFLAAVAQDPVLAEVKLIAEPWDVGMGGYLLGGFPPPWREWNGRFRDTARDAWLHPGTAQGASARRDLGQRLTGSADLFAAAHRGPTASVDLITSHDGFPLADLVSYDTKRNEANGEGGHDGSDDEHSSGAGADGPTELAAVLDVRRLRRRALLATLLLARGVPMLLAGDELGRTQRGNNNAYCQDNDLSWVDWRPLAERPHGLEPGADPAGDDPLLLPLVTALVRLRREHPSLLGDVSDGYARDVVWLTPHGLPMTAADWEDPAQAALLAWWPDPSPDASGAPHRERAGSWLLALNPGAQAVDVVLPGHPYAAVWTTVLDTTAVAVAVDPAPPRRLPGVGVVLVRGSGAGGSAAVTPSC